MKTYYFSSAKSISIFSIMGLLSVVMASCGSYKNSSYYDGDGIYGGSEVKKADTQTQSAANESSQYKDYFSSLQKEGPVEVFTDVESYNSTENTNTTEGSYAGWGNNSEHVTVNVYDNSWAWNGWNNYWYGPSYGWGWNIGYNSWYGPSFGWGWNNYWYGQSYYPYYGWGWNNYYNGYYNPYYYGYGYNHYYPRTHGVRGSYRGDRYDSGRRSATGTRNGNYIPGRTRTTIGGTRTSNYNNPPRRSETPRNYSPNPRTNTNNSTPRTYTPTRSETSTPRGNTRSESSTPRNYSSGSNSNSGSGGSYGGGRSGGGGRR